MRDEDFGIVRAARLRHLRLQDRRREDCSCKEVAGSDHNFRLDEFADTMRSRIVSVFTDALATAKVPVLDVATRYTELGEALLPLINPVIVAPSTASRSPSFIVENVSRAARGRGGHRQALEHGRDRQPERLREVPDGAGHASRAAAAARRAWRPSWPSGFAMAQQMMQQPGGIARPARRRARWPAGSAAPRRPRARRRPGPSLPDLLTPAEVAQALGVAEADVIADHRVRRAEGEEDRLERSASRATALDAFLAD